MQPKQLKHIAIAALLLPASAFAATSTPVPLVVTATVLTSCIAVTTPVVFGNYDPTSASPTVNTGTVLVTCTTGTPYNVLLDAGASTGATVTTRKMKDAGTNHLPYNLYSDGGRTTNWGMTVGTDTVAGTATGIAQTLTVYGRIPAGATAPAGAYTDTVNVTVSY